LCRIEIRIKPNFERVDLLHLEIIEKAVRSGEDDDDLLLRRKRCELRLLEDLGEALAAVELVQRDLVQVATELREGCQFTKLRQIKLQGSRHLAHRLDLRTAAYAAD